jgi:hypothetical protein
MALEPTWIERAAPLTPAGLVAPIGVVPALRARLLARDDEALARLRGVATASEWIVIGPEGELPWIDGLTYIGRDPEAPALWVPTYLALTPPAPLVERAIRARFGEPPFVVIGSPMRVVSMGAARPLDRGTMERSDRCG